MQNKIEGNIVDYFNKEIFYGELVYGSKIISINKIGEVKNDKPYIMPGFTDAHVHIESSLLTPVQFAALALRHGTISTISDPHEIANVCGIDGVYFMIENGKQVPLKFYFGAPSCVPATQFETAGAIIGTNELETLLKTDDIVYLAEMMNFPGVIYNNEEVHKKLSIAKKYGKPIDGHAPGLRGNDAQKYFSQGITTDHECFSYEEALEKINLGVKILIREGSAAKNFDALINLLKIYPNQIMFCSDDKHPDELIIGHINQLCKRAAALNIDIWNIIQAACINPVEHYKTEVGLLRVNDNADFIVVDNLSEFNVVQTFINGVSVFQNHQICFELPKTKKELNQFFSYQINKNDIQIPHSGNESIKAIVALNNQIVTEEELVFPLKDEQYFLPNPEADILKIVVVNRYNKAKPASAFIKNFGIKTGAIGSTVAHDSHNIIVVGVNDEDIINSVHLLMKHKGGLCVCDGEKQSILPLPIAGLMSDNDAETVSQQYMALDAMAKNLGTQLNAPFMTLSFMALLVIPKLKLSDKGLFDGEQFKFVYEI